MQIKSTCFAVSPFVQFPEVLIVERAKVCTSVYFSKHASNLKHKTGRKNFELIIINSSHGCVFIWSSEVGFLFICYNFVYIYT